jgi:hypothetical protein
MSFLASPSVDSIVARIRAQCPAFATVTDVYGYADDVALPAAFVARIGAQATAPALFDQHVQMIRLTFGVYVIVARRDTPFGGVSPSAEVEALETAVINALSAWPEEPQPGTTPLAFAGAVAAPWRDSVSEWRLDFVTEIAFRRP